MSDGGSRVRADVSMLAPGDTLALEEAGDGGVLLCNVDGEIHAVRNRCTHAAVLLSDAPLDGAELECPYHGARFDVTTGACTAPARRNLCRYKVLREGNTVEVDLDSWVE
jgi:nitrite reductase/ring-hydroxylating ferredoxin subunit